MKMCALMLVACLTSTWLWVIIAGCASAQHLKPVAYTAEQLECVKKYDAEAPMDECINEVKAKYGRLDGGAK